jgi:hypothetical protein
VIQAEKGLQKITLSMRYECKCHLNIAGFARHVSALVRL